MRSSVIIVIRVSQLSIRAIRVVRGKASSKNMKTKTVLTVFSLALGAVCTLSVWAQNAAPSIDDSFAKYGQEFKGKIGRTYAGPPKRPKTSSANEKNSLGSA
jgi:hypothetical protein